MFRRKGEDSLFDTATDQNQIDLTSNEAAAPAAPASATSQVSTPAAAPASANSPLAGGNNPITRPSADTAPTRPEPRNVGASTGFRPNTSPLSQPLGSELGRNRMPEAKAASVASASSGMTMEKSKTGRRVLTVGNDILLKGEIATCDRLVIEGKVDATLNEVHTVEISETGSFKGSANIEDAEISGLFEGDLVVRNRLVIYATGKVRGKISYGEIEIERGGELTGEIKTTNPATAQASRPARGSKEDKMAAA